MQALRNSKRECQKPLPPMSSWMSVALSRHYRTAIPGCSSQSPVLSFDRFSIRLYFFTDRVLVRATTESHA